MQCPICQFENREGAKFCSECGHHFAVICPECGTKVRDSSKFCDECGFAFFKSKPETPQIDFSNPKTYTPKYLAEKILTTRNSVEGERKVVSVLFADLANFTSISEMLTPEEVHSMMNDFFKILMDEIHKYEGTINQFTGDGIMSLFGAPMAHEDHASRACYSAIAIQKRMIELRNKFKNTMGIDLRLRIGLNTGPVVVGSIGDDLRMDYTALGDTTNLAARMQQCAEPGQTYMSESIYKIVKNHFSVECLGKLQIKGKRKPILAYRLKRSRGIKTLMDIQAEKKFSPIVGRSEELKHLLKLWDDSKKGNGQVVFIVGEAGIGKSRLVFEIFRKLSKEDITWLEGHCLSHGRNMPFSALIDLLKRNFRIEEEDTEDIVIQKIDKGLDILGTETKDRAPFLKFLFSVDPGEDIIKTMDVQGRRRMIFDSIRLMTISGSKRKPIILIFENLQWMDPDSEEFLKYIIDSLSLLPVMLILTYRPIYKNPFGERTYFNRISLQAFRDDESFELIQKLLAGKSIPDHLRSLLLKRAEGNPFYIEEIINSIKEIEALEKIDKQANSNGHYQIKIPTTIQGIIMSRIDRLPENCKNILQCAAVIGRKFSYNLLEKFVENNENMTEILAHLLSLELIYQTDFYPELVYMFKNALTQEVTYENILSPKKKFIHAEIGRRIEKLYSSRQAEYYELISHHYEMGEIWDKSIEYFLLSGQKALQNMANQSAKTFFNRAVEISEQEGIKLQNEQKFEIHYGKGNADFNMGHYRNSENAFLKAREVAKYIGDKNKEGQSLSMAGWSQAVGKKYEEAIATYKEAIDFAVKNNDPIIEGRNLVGLGVIETYLGHVREASDYIEKAVNIGKKINSPLILTFAYSIRAFQFPHYAIPDEEAVGYLKDAIPTLKSLQNARACVHVYLILGYNYACQGNYSLSINSIQEGINFATGVEDDLSRSRGLNWLGWVYGDLGFISKAKKLNELSQKASLKVGLGSEEPEANAIVNLAENAIEERNFRLAEEYLLSLGEKAESDPSYLSMRHRWEVRKLHGLSKIALNKKEYRKAFKYAHKALDIANETLNVRGKIKLNRLLGDIYIKINDINNANEKIKLALTEAIKIENPSQLWRTYYAFGRLKEVEGNWEEAEKQYLNAIHIIEKIKRDISDKEIRDNFMNYFPVTRVQYNINRIKTRVGDKF